MPAFIEIANTIKVALDILLYGQSLVNTFHLNRPGGWDLTSMHDAVETFGNWITDNLLGVVSEDMSWIGADVTDLSAVDAPSIYETFSAPLDGTKVGHAVPLNVAGVISLQTDKRGRSYRGRSYLPGIAESDRTSGGDFTTALATAIAGGYGVLGLYTGPDLSAIPVVASRYNAGAARAAGVTNAWSGIRMDTLFDSQRRRLVGRGD